MKPQLIKTLTHLTALALIVALSSCGKNPPTLPPPTPLATDWIQTTANAAFPARRNHTNVVYDGKMWVIGGMNGSLDSDIWCSNDGATWTLATANAAFFWRNAHTSVVYDGKMWVIGGCPFPSYNDVWYSTDGANWTEATAMAHRLKLINDLPERTVE